MSLGKQDTVGCGDFTSPPVRAVYRKKARITLKFSQRRARMRSISRRAKKLGCQRDDDDDVDGSERDKEREKERKIRKRRLARHFSKPAGIFLKVPLPFFPSRRDFPRRLITLRRSSHKTPFNLNQRERVYYTC